MANHIENIDIVHFRGIHSLAIDNLNHINIIAGDNNSGKTSVLEAMLLLRNPNDFTNILRIARMRDTNTFFSGTPVYESFINLFPRDIARMEVAMNAKCRGKNVAYKLLGEQKKIMMDPEDVLKKLNAAKRNRMMRDMDTEFIEVDEFSGELIFEVDSMGDKIPVEIDTYATTSGREIKKDNFMNMVYLSPTDHVRGFVFDSIIRNDVYKKICLRILQLFDLEIVDLVILKNEDNSRSTEYVKHAKLGNCLLYTSPSPRDGATSRMPSSA